MSHKKKTPTPAGVRVVPTPDYGLCQLHSAIGQSIGQLHQLPDAATVRTNRLRSVPLETLPMPF